jgi:hypothetical protein
MQKYFQKPNSTHDNFPSERNSTKCNYVRHSLRQSTSSCECSQWLSVSMVFHYSFIPLIWANLFLIHLSSNSKWISLRILFMDKRHEFQLLRFQ